MGADTFSDRVLKWYDKHGRYDLPWQKNQTPYRVWVSEIMLQQTQVNTVIPYFQKFIRRFPNVKSLAKADIDDVLHHWSGLGYYARGRNLHQSAITIHHQFHGRFPKSIPELENLPGIGRSTAGAILSLSADIPAPILDGNVKRVLTRFFAISGWTGSTQTIKNLWEVAEKLTPRKRCRDYNQAMMDLGSIICTRSKPKCGECPLNLNCQAFLSDQTALFPNKKPKAKIPQKKAFFLMIQNHNGDILLEKRPPTGIWGGLWCFPECLSINDIERLCKKRFFNRIDQTKNLSPIKHVFSHFELSITPVQLRVKLSSHQVMDSSTQVWYNLNENLPGGIPAPVTKLLRLYYDPNDIL